MATTDIGIKLSLQGANEVQSGLDRVGTGLRGMATNAKESVSSVKELALAMGAAFSVKSIIDAADAVTTLRNQLKLATGSASEAKTAYAALFDVAQRARVSFTDLGGTYASLARAGEQLGVSQQRLLGVTEAISNAVTISGGSAESAKAALVQLSQGLASGTLRGDELNSVMEQTPRLASALAAGLGVTTGELRKLGEAGEITADKVIRALESQAGVLKGEVAGSVLTVGQAWQQLQNASVKTIGDFDAATGASSTLASAMQALAGAITTVGQAAREHETATKVFFGLIAGAAVATTVGAIASALGGLVTVIGGIGGAVATVGAVIAAANPVTLALLGIGAAVGAVAAYSSAQGKNLDTVSQKISDISQEITELDAAIERSKGAKGVLLGNGAVTTKERANDLVADLRKQRAEMQALLAENTAPSASMLLRRIDNQEDAAARAQDKINAEQIEKARALVKTKNAILDAGYKEAVTIAQNYQGAIDAAEKSGDTDKQRELIAQRSALLIASAKETAEAVKSFNERDTATAREAAKERLEVQIAGYERAGQAFDDYQKQQQKSLETAHALGLTSESEYIRAKEQLELGVNQGKQDLAQQELQAVQKSGLLQKDRIAQEQKYTTEIQKLKDQQVQIANEAADAIALAEQKELRAAIDSNAQTVESAQGRASQLQEQLRAQQAANKEIGLSAKEVIALRTATAELAAVELERRAGLIDDAKPAYAQALRDQATAIRGIASANAEALEKSAAIEQFNRVWESVDRTAHDTFVNIFQGGQDAFTKLRDVLKATLLDLLYQMTVRKWVFNIVADVVPGASDATAAAVSGSGTLGSLSNLSSLSSLAKFFGFGSSSAGASLTSLAYANGVGVVGGDSMGALISANGGWSGVSTGTATGAAGASSAGMTSFAGIPVAGWIAMGMMASNEAYSQGFRADTSSTGLNALNPNHILNFTDRVLQGLGIDGRTAAILSGSALGAAAQNFVFGGSGNISQIGGGVAGTIGGNGAAISAYDAYKQDHRGFLGIGSFTTENREWHAADSGLTQYINDTTKLVTGSVKGYAFALGLTTDAVDSYTKQIDVSLAGLDPAKQKEAIDKAIGGFGEDLVGSVYGDVLKGLGKSGETAGGTLQRLATDLLTVNDMLKQLHEPLLDVSVTGAASAAKLVDAFGGLDKMNESVGVYYDRFYSDSEKAANSMAGVNSAFEKLGIAAPQSKEQFRALVDSLDLTTDSGRTLYAAIISLAPAFDAASQAAQAAQGRMLSAIQNWGTADDVRNFKAQQLQQMLAKGGLNVDMNTILGATKDSVLSYYKSLSDGPIKTLLEDNQQAIYDLVTSGQTGNTSTAFSDGGGGGGAGQSAADSIKSAWQSITDSIWDEVKRIRGLLEGTGPEAYAAAQARFAITTAQARAGDQDAAKALPEVSRTLQELAQQNAASALDLRILQGKSAASLAETATILARKYGLSVPKFAAGTNYTQEGLAYLHEGEAVVPKAYNPAAGASLDRSTALIDAVRSLATRLDVIEANTRASAQFGGSISRDLKKVMPDGDAIEVRIAPV